MHAKFALFRRRRRRRHQIVSFLSLLLQPIFVRVIRISHVSLTYEKPFARLEFNRKKLPNELLMKIAEIKLCKHVGLQTLGAHHQTEVAGREKKQHVWTNLQSRNTPKRSNFIVFANKMRNDTHRMRWINQQLFCCCRYVEAPFR